VRGLLPHKETLGFQPISGGLNLLWPDADTDRSVLLGNAVWGRALSAPSVADDSGACRCTNSHLALLKRS